MSERDDRAGGVSRRTFLQWGALSGVALVVGVDREGRIVSARHAAGAERAPFAPNQWLRIDDAGVVTIVAARSEMGQGVRTALPMIVADELGADWTTVRIEHARPGPEFREMRTSGSGSVSGAWVPLRRAAASARAMLVAAAAAQWNVDPASCRTENGRVRHAASGRELPFGALVARAAALPVPASAPVRPDSELRLLGTSVPRVDGPAIVRGTAIFGSDVRVPGMRFAAIARAPRAGATARPFDESRARALPGVRQVVRISNGIAVVADDTWTAFRARDALGVQWIDPAGPPPDSADARRRLEAALPNGKVARREGDAAQALAGAARRLTATYRNPFQAHAALEPLTCVAHVRDGGCELWVGTQAPNEAQREVATLLGIAPDRVTVNVTLIGGAFGRRLAVDYAVEAAEVSRAIGGPVQVAWSREDDMRHDWYQPAQVNRLSAGLDAAGRIVAWRHEVADFNLTMFGAYDPNFDPAADGDPWGGFDTPYAFPSLDVTLALLETPVPTGAWRAVSYPAAVFARESFVDEVAYATRRDPLALRLSLIPSPGTKQRGALTLPNGDRLRHVLQLAADRADWGKPAPAIPSGRAFGRGIACNSYHDGTMVAQVAEVSVGQAGDVRVHRVVCAVDCGRIINRSGLEAQFESGVIWALSSALKSEITFTNGRIVQGNYHDFPVMRMGESPRIEVHMVESTLRPFGAGEPPVPAVAPAVLNAVFAATGRRVRDLPLRDDALRQA